MPSRRPEPRASRVQRDGVRFRREVRALGVRVRSLRLDRGWTLEEAAEAMDLDWKHLQKIETGMPPINVTILTLVRIAEGLKVSLRGLFDRDSR